MGPLPALMVAKIVTGSPKPPDECSGLILGLRLANERRRYKVTPSLTG